MNKTILKNPLFFGFIIPGVVDMVMTLVGQEGDRVNEASPAYYALLLSPWMFLAGSLVWFLMWYKIFLRLKEPWNLWLMLVFLTGHSWGSGSWLWKMMKENGIYKVDNQISVMLAWGVMMVYLAVISLAAAKGIISYEMSKVQGGNGSKKKRY